MGSNEKALLRTLIYSSVFGFPLREDELFYYLIAEKKISQSTFQRSLKNLQMKIVKKNGLLALPEQEQSIAKRVVWDKETARKRNIAQHVAKLLAMIPTVSFIGISGGVAAGQAESDDDIDLFVISKKHTLFVTRLLALLLLTLVGKRRKRQATKVKDLICLNMLLDESALYLPGGKHNVYLAHEIAQVYPLFERDSMYQKFLKANDWIASLLPHAGKGRNIPYQKAKKAWLAILFVPFELPAKYLQMLFIKRHVSREIVKTYMLALHPVDYQTQILTRYKRALQMYEKYYNTSLQK